MKEHILIQLEKKIAGLIIDRIIPDNNPNVFQLSFTIHN
jgi:hypothetical protein